MRIRNYLFALLMAYNLFADETNYKIIIDKSERKLYLQNMEFSVGIGKLGYETPTGDFEVINKIKRPYFSPSPKTKWLNQKQRNYLYKYGSIPSDSPLNPLCDYWISISPKGLGIHDIDRDKGIGERSSHGCIRVKRKDMKIIFENTNIGDRIKIQE